QQTSPPLLLPFLCLSSVSSRSVHAFVTCPCPCPCRQQVILVHFPIDDSFYPSLPFSFLCLGPLLVLVVVSPAVLLLTLPGRLSPPNTSHARKHTFVCFVLISSGRPCFESNGVRYVLKLRVPEDHRRWRPGAAGDDR
ncbi:unnamed protein product, partial [Pylaiella littoralis]